MKSWYKLILSKLHSQRFSKKLYPTGPRWAPCWPHEQVPGGPHVGPMNRSQMDPMLAQWTLLSGIVMYRQFLPILFGNVSWWGHDMETLSALLFLCEGNQPITGSQMLAKINNWKNSRVAGDFRGQWRPCDIIVMFTGPSICELDLNNGVMYFTWFNRTF